MNVCLLRYFNPVGAHPSGTPHRPPTLDYQAEPCEGEGEGEVGRSPPTPDKQAGPGQVLALLPLTRARLASDRPHRRGPQGHTQQPHALHPAGGPNPNPNTLILVYPNITPVS